MDKDYMGQVLDTIPADRLFCEIMDRATEVVDHQARLVSVTIVTDKGDRVWVKDTKGNEYLVSDTEFKPWE